MSSCFFCCPCLRVGSISYRNRLVADEGVKSRTRSNFHKQEALNQGEGIAPQKTAWNEKVSISKLSKLDPVDWQEIFNSLDTRYCRIVAPSRQLGGGRVFSVLEREHRPRNSAPQQVFFRVDAKRGVFSSGSLSVNLSKSLAQTAQGVSCIFSFSTQANSYVDDIRGNIKADQVTAYRLFDNSGVVALVFECSLREKVEPERTLEEDDLRNREIRLEFLR